jgi:hypothetical protein
LASHSEPDETLFLFDMSDILASPDPALTGAVVLDSAEP